MIGGLAFLVASLVLLAPVRAEEPSRKSPEEKSAAANLPAPVAAPTPGSNVWLQRGPAGGGTGKPYSWRLIPRDGPATASLVEKGGGGTAVALADTRTFKRALLYQLEKEGRLFDRWMVLGLAPSDLRAAGTVTLAGGPSDGISLEVDLSSFAVANPGLRNVPIGRAVLLQGKNRPHYSWTLESPPGSKAVLADAETQNPYFVPDVPGSYRVLEAGKRHLTVTAGLWWGGIVHREMPRRPRWFGKTVGVPVGQEQWKVGCICHFSDRLRPIFDAWYDSGHAEIFIRVINFSESNGEECFPCHTVGFRPGVDDRGFDDAPGYADFIQDPELWERTGRQFRPHPDENNWNRFFDRYPKVAQFSNVQCENCHGPNDSLAHKTLQKTGAQERISLAAEVCGSCHEKPRGDPSYRQWQTSGHANHRLATETSTVDKRGTESGNCGRCHSAQGFLAWSTGGERDRPISGDRAELEARGLAEQMVEPITCCVCHSPHHSGNSFRNGKGKVPVRIAAGSPVFPKGLLDPSPGRAALCFLCHSLERGANPDGTIPHAPQSDLLAGRNAFFVPEGKFKSHARIQDGCIWCHLKPVPDPPATGGYPRGGTRHDFHARSGDCADCHRRLKGEDMLGPAFDLEVFLTAIASDLDDLKSDIERGIMEAIRRGDEVTIGDDSTGTAHSTFAARDIERLEIVELQGKAAVALTARQGEGRQGAIHALKIAGRPFSESVSGEVLEQAVWNYFMIKNDRSRGAHNPGFVLEILDATRRRITSSPDSGG